MGGESRAGMIMMKTKSESPKIGLALAEEDGQSSQIEA